MSVLNDTTAQQSPPFNPILPPNSQVFASLQNAIAANIPTGTQFVQTYGYYTGGDNGGALYVPSNASNLSGFQSNDGAYWKLAGPPYYAEQFGAKGDGVTNDSSVLQNAINYLSSIQGRRLEHKSQKYLCNVILKNGVLLIGQGENGIFGQPNPGTGTVRTIYINASSGFIVDTPNTGASFAGLIGIDLQGLGTANSNGGLRLQNGSSYCTIKQCSGAFFSNQFLQIYGGGHVIEDFMCNSSVLNTTRTQVTGAFELYGYDTFVNRGEVGCSLAGLSSSNMYCVGAYINGSSFYINNLIGENSDIGIYFSPTNTIFSIVGCNATGNFAHGFWGGGASELIGCTAQNNGLSANNTYSGFFDGGQAQITYTACKSFCLTGSTIFQKYGFDGTNSNSAPNARHQFNGCSGYGNASGNYGFVGIANTPSISCSTALVSYASVGDSNTPNVDNVSNYQIGPTDTITNFLNGVPGQVLRILGNTGATIANNSNIKTYTGATITTASNKIYTFVNWGGNGSTGTWMESFGG